MDMNGEFDKKAETRYRDLTETPVPQLILRLSVPTIISMLVTAIYNAADTFFVGKISTEATAAVLSFRRWDSFVDRGPEIICPGCLAREDEERRRRWRLLALRSLSSLVL